MGADIIGWRACPLQQELGEDRFALELKLVAVRDGLEESREQVEQSGKKLEELQLNLCGAGAEPLALPFPDLVTRTDGFRQGIAECDTCPLANHKRLGCYRSVSYPVDAVFERLFFEFYVGQAEEESKAASVVHRFIVSGMPEEVAALWTERRGKGGALGGDLAELPEPLAATLPSGQSLTSAQVLPALFLPLPTFEAIQTYALMWTDFLGFVIDHGAPFDASLTLREGLQVHLLLAGALELCATSPCSVLVRP